MFVPVPIHSLFRYRWHQFKELLYWVGWVCWGSGGCRCLKRGSGQLKHFWQCKWPSENSPVSPEVQLVNYAEMQPSECSQRNVSRRKPVGFFFFCLLGLSKNSQRTELLLSIPDYHDGIVDPLNGNKHWWYCPPIVCEEFFGLRGVRSGLFFKHQLASLANSVSPFFEKSPIIINVPSMTVMIALLEVQSDL